MLIIIITSYIKQYVRFRQLPWFGLDISFRAATIYFFLLGVIMRTSPVTFRIYSPTLKRRLNQDNAQLSYRTMGQIYFLNL